MWFLILTYGLVISVSIATPEPCDTLNFINDWRRTVNYSSTADNCDNILEEGWYRITSGAGEGMPTECPKGGFKCNTIRPIYLEKDAVPPGENVFPDVGVTVDRIAVSSNYYGNCSYETYNIQIKGCVGYLVYKLVPTRGCVSAYCFGNQLPCPNGTHSDTGFTPGCSASPTLTVSPYVKTLLWSTNGTIHGINWTYIKPVFECHAANLVNGYIYQVRWYVNDLEIEEAKATNLSKSQIENGDGRMKEEHWKTKFKPNMLVKCSIQVGGNGYPKYGPEHFSDTYFAGVKVMQSSPSHYTVKEGETIQIPIQLTMPLACEWKTFDSASNINYIKSECTLVLFNGLPEYQAHMCQNGITTNNVAFKSERCGVAFKFEDWDKTRFINITGSSDGMVSRKDRIVFLRLFNDVVVNAPPSLSYWRNIHLPDIKVSIVDSDVTTLGKACHSNNDPHMKTFDGIYWELQSYLRLPQGEYIMYKHDRLPLQVSAWFQDCYRGILCNCGVAVRSGDSVFVANYCETHTYYGQRRVNRYRIQTLCDDQSLIVEKSSNSYTITIPTGTKVTFNYDNRFIHSIRIIPSILDYGLTSGLCGRFNHDTSDDFIPRGKLVPVPVTSNKEFAESWLIQGVYADETLFNSNGILKPTLYHGQQYCTCKTNSSNFPHESPAYKCNLTTAMELCRKEKTLTGVISAKCANHANGRRKREILDRYIVKREVDVDEDDVQPPIFPMVGDEYTQSTITVEWNNGWTEATARQHCESKFTEAPAYDVCTEYVPFIDPEPYIESCILDIKYSGGDDWTKITIRNYASSCLQESKRLENLTTTNSTNSNGISKSIAEIVAESTCFEDCFKNGICIEGECHCFSGYYGDLCSDTKSKAPTVIGDAFENACDISIKPCNNILFPATGIINSLDLKCKRKLVQIKLNKGNTVVEEKETTVHTGTYFNDLYAKCPLHGTRRKRSADDDNDDDVVATAYVLSISNDGQNYSETVTTIVFNSTCYACNSSTLTCIKKDTYACQDEQGDEEENKEKDEGYVLFSTTGLIIGAGLGGAVVLIVVTIICLKLCKSKPRDRYIKDSSVSLPDTSRQCAPKSSYITNKNITLNERSRTKSSLY